VDARKKSTYAEGFRIAILMRPFFVCCVFSCLVSLFSGKASGQSAGDDVYRVSVRLVNVDVQVSARKTHKTIRNLRQDDFEIYEDNVRQQITSFSQDRLPLSIVFLFDLTDSVRPVLKSLAAGAMEALQHLKPEDEVAVMTYSASGHLIQDFTTDHELAVAAMRKASHMESDEAAFFNEGIFQAAKQLAKGHNPSSRRVVIWLTDDIPNFPSEETRARYGRSLGKARLHSEAEATAELLHAGATVSTLLQRSEISDEEFSLRMSKAAQTMLDNMRYPPGSVNKYALASGGEVIETSTKRMQEHLASLIDNLRLRYTLCYRPAITQPKGKFSAIKVRLTPEARKTIGGQVTISARQGYYH
jgi:VWFA-related protein